jgi:hypothetical protein
MQLVAAEWCEQQFGCSQLGDRRRTRRLVEIATHMSQQPDGSIPQQMRASSRTKAVYRFMDTEGLSHQTVQQAHWQHSRLTGLAQPTLLLIQDTTYIDLTGRAVADVGVIGDGNGQGFVLHTTLGVIPDSEAVVGLMHQQVYRRHPTRTRGEASTRRVKRATEARFWQEAVQAIGEVPSQTRWVYVADRGGDVFTFYGACRHHHADLLVRVAQDRRIQDGEGQMGHLFPYLRQLPAMEQMQVTVTDKAKNPRQAFVQVAFAPLILLPPVHVRPDTPAAQGMYGIRVWEAQPPEGVAPLEWLLVTSLPIEDSRQTIQYVEWYAHRPLIEDYHQCLKTGCQLERRQLHTASRFERLIGVLGVVAIYLLQLRCAARLPTQSPTEAGLDNDMQTVIALHLHIAPQQLTARQAWLWIAQQGGYLNRKHDPPPGWKCLWQGWHYLQSLVHGFRLARTNFS